MRTGAAVATAGLILGTMAGPRRRRQPPPPAPASPQPGATAAATAPPAIPPSGGTVVHSRPVPTAPPCRSPAAATGRVRTVAELAPAAHRPVRAWSASPGSPARLRRPAGARCGCTPPPAGATGSTLAVQRRRGPGGRTRTADVRAGTGAAVGRAAPTASRCASGRHRAGAPADVQVVTVDPGPDPAGAARLAPAASPADSGDPIERLAAASRSMPRIISRRQWGADPSLADPCGAPRYGRTAKMVFVHHTVGRQQLLGARVAGDRAQHLRLPHAGSGLVRHRLQRAGRPLRQHLRRPPRRHAQAGARRARR